MRKKKDAYTGEDLAFNLSVRETSSKMHSSELTLRNVSVAFNASDSLLYGDGYYDNGEDQLILFQQILDVINKYVIPVIVGVGLCGNLLSLVVFMGTYLRKESLSVYLSALAIADSGCLISIFIVWLDIWNVTIFHKNGMCQFTVYFTYVCSFLSIWFIVTFIAERYIAVCFPLKRRQMCTPYRAKVVTCSMAFLALFGYSFVLGISGTRNFESYTLCIHLPEHMAITTALTYTDSLVAFVIPFMALLSMNGKILHKLAKVSRNQHDSGRDQELRIHGRVPSPVNSAQLNATKLMVVISSVFVIISIPSYAIKMRLIVISFLDRHYLAKPEEFLWQAVFEFIYYINFSINFFLYSICLKKFRMALRMLIENMKHRSEGVVKKLQGCFTRGTHPMTIEVSDVVAFSPDGSVNLVDREGLHKFTQRTLNHSGILE